MNRILSFTWPARWRTIIRVALLLMPLCGPAGAQMTAPATGPLVLAAASLQESLSAAADTWTKQGHARPTLAFAGSSVLARQIEAGAPADLFVSADEAWMDELAARRLIDPGSRRDLVGNRLVLAAPVGTRGRVPLARVPLARLLAAGPLAMADPDAVPAGRYGKAALVALGVWDTVAAHIVIAADVRGALALVERGVVPFAIVYATDAAVSPKVRIAGVFPSNRTPPIVYPIARLRASSSRDAEAFRRFLISPAGKATFVRFGFSAR